MPLDKPASAQCSSGDCDHPKDVCLPHSTDSSDHRHVEVPGDSSDMGRGNCKFPSTMSGRHIETHSDLNADACVLMPKAKRRKYGSIRRRAQSRTQAYKRKEKLTENFYAKTDANVVVDISSLTCAMIESKPLSCSLYRLQCKSLNPVNKKVNVAVSVPPDSIMFDRI